MFYTLRNRTKSPTTEELIWSICFAFFIPAVTGIVSITTQKNTTFFYYAAFALLSFGLWRLNKFIFFYLKAKINLEREYGNKRYWLLTTVFVFSSLATVFFLLLWNCYARPAHSDWKSFIDSFLLLVGFSFMVTLLEENNLLNLRKQNNLLEKEKAERLKIEAELEVLKNQVDPHFLFNSLNTMSFLIETDQAKAKLFNDRLADVYQYILLNKQKDLVTLEQELEFVERYFHLLTIRYPEGLEMNVHIDQRERNKLLPPLSLQTLLENAVKHNSFSQEQPLLIEIFAKNGNVSVKNNLPKPNPTVRSCGLGLENLSARYELISQKIISIHNDPKYFLVKLPLLNTLYNV